MKILSLFVFLTCYSFISYSQTYQQLWKQADSLISIKNYRESAEIILKIRNKAIAENNKPEKIRTILAEHKALTINSENTDSFNAINKHFQNHLNNTKGIERSLIASFYAQHLLSNISIQKVDTKNYQSLSIENRVQIIDSLFKISLSHKDELIKEPLLTWKTLLNSENEIRLTPTIYHILALNYLDFLNVDPANDSLCLSLKQEIQEVNKKNNYKDASAYLIYRPYINNYSYNRDSDDTLLNLIPTIESEFNAYVYYHLARQKNPKEALTLLKTAKEKYPKSPWIANVDTLMEELSISNISIDIPVFVPSQEYFPIKITHKNADKLYIRVYDISKKSKTHRLSTASFDYHSKQFSIDAPLVYQELVGLKDFDDPYSYVTKYKLNPLPYGKYQILVSNNPDFKEDGIYQETISGHFYVSDMFITAYEKNHTEDVYVYSMLIIDRKTGKPLANKPIELFSKNDKDYNLKKLKQYKTNAVGELTFRHNFSKLDLDEIYLYNKEENQWISLDELTNIPELHKEEREELVQNEKNSIIMTDRAIYRPGQSVYFKAIVYNNHFKLGKIAENKQLNIRLKDANNQELKSVKLSTNSFGSINGTFELPKQTLNGHFSIEILHQDTIIGTKHFNVEEYKRPTFKVSFEPNKNTYTKKDTAIFVGKVESLTGAILPNSTVKYTINISSYYPKYFNKNIENNITTDLKGEFRIAIPLADTSFRNFNTFNININAEVKSPSEEIQTASTSYSYKDQPKSLRISAKSAQKEFTWKTVTVSTTNTNGFPLPFAGQINIYKYEPLHLPLGENSFKFSTGYDILDTLDYQKYFPHYYDKALHHTQRRKTLVVSYPFDTHKTDIVQIDSTLFGYGEYLVEGLSIVSPKDTLRSTSNVKIIQQSTGKYSNNTFLSYALDKNEYKKNDTVQISFYSDVQDVHNLFLWKIDGTTIHPATIVPFDGNKAIYKYVIEPTEDLPKTHFEVLLLKNNNIKKLTINIPYQQRNKKNINIITKTFRDKITPGQKEKWTFTLQRNETKAEVLATMYDSSIDQFASNYLSDNFYFNYPYFDRHSLYHIIEEFREAAYWQNHINYKQKLYQSFVIPQIKNYGLWSKSIYPYNRLIIRKDKDGNPIKEQILIRGAAIQNKMTMTGSVASLDEVVVMGAAQGRAAGVDVDHDGVFENRMYDELKAPELRAEVEELKQRTDKENALNSVRARTDLKETAFFYPELYTDEEGNVSFELESPEALTKWKLLLFAHTKDLQSGNASFYTHTQKQLMVQPNLPRYMRVGDQITLKSLISNLSEDKIQGSARLQIIDPRTDKVIANLLPTDTETKDFTITAKNNSTVSWQIHVPEGYPTVIIKVVAASDEFSDGEQQELAILPNDILISETQKIVIAKDHKNEFLINSLNKNNLQAQVIVQSNPILEILSSLEYLKNYPYECAEQTASKWFGIKMIQYLHKHYPAISTYFNTLDTANIGSSLRDKMSTNELSLEEMPWLRTVLNDDEKMKQLATLFNKDNIQADLKVLEERLKKLQNKDGSFVWFDGGKTNIDISIRLLEIFGKVHHLDKDLISKENQKMISKLKSYFNQDNLFAPSTAYAQIIDFAYANQYWNSGLADNKEQKSWIVKTLKHSPLSSAKQAAGVAAKSWVVANQYGLKAEANAIFNRLDQEYVLDSIAGMYWKSNADYYNAVSLHTYLIEAYKALKPQHLKAMADWIFYNKTHNNWKTTWMSVDAIYALLLANNPGDFDMENKVSIWVDNSKTEPKQSKIGQVSMKFNPQELEANKLIKIENQNNRKIYGSIVHQYFLPLEQIKASSKDISVKKHVLVFRNNEWISTKNIKSGEKVKIRLEVISNKNLNFVHLKDNRAAGFEPEYRPSGYQFRYGGYYFTNKDASTNYFIDYLPKGTHIFEYEVKTNNIGIFNSGISQIECMYDPAVNARSGNLKIEIKE